MHLVIVYNGMQDLAKRPELWQELYEIQKQLNQDLTDWQGANPDAPATRALTSTPAVQLCDQLLQQLRERALGGDEQAMAQARYLLDKKSDAKHASRGLGTDSALASTASAAGQALVFKQVDPKPEIGIRSSATSQQPPLNFWESFIDKCSRAWDVLSDRRSTLTPMWRWGAFKAGYVAKSRVKRVLLIDR